MTCFKEEERSLHSGTEGKRAKGELRANRMASKKKKNNGKMETQKINIAAMDSVYLCIFNGS